MSILSRERNEQEELRNYSFRHEDGANGNGKAVSIYLQRKRKLDCLMAAALLLPGLPIIGALVLLVRLTSRGPGIFRQARVGQNGKPFTLLKIRTMTVDAEAGSGAVWATEKDPRVTRIGRVLRRLHLDEFPQLLNVIRGEMSLVGPRPERPEFVEVLEKAVPRYRDRLLAPPGMTGLAQLNLPPDTHLCCVCRKLALDLDYVEHAGLLIDLRIIFYTITWLLGILGDNILRVSGLMRTPHVAHCLLEDGLEGVMDKDAAALDPHSLRCEVARRMNGHDTKHLLPGARQNAKRQSKSRVGKPR